MTLTGLMFMPSIAMALVLFAAQDIKPGQFVIEVRRNVAVVKVVNDAEKRGVLYLNDSTAKPFRLKKGQRFDMVRIGQEGGCSIKVGKRLAELSSCPWLDGFTDHQADIFRIVKK